MYTGMPNGRPMIGPAGGHAAADAAVLRWAARAAARRRAVSCHDRCYVVGRIERI